MGNLLRALSKLEGAGDCCNGSGSGGGASAKNIFVDFEGARPHSREDEEVYNRAEDVILRAEEILEALRQYKGATKEIRDAISNPSAESESAAWSALRPLVVKLQTFFDFSRELDAIVPELLAVLCSTGTTSDSESTSTNLFEQLDEHQAIVKQFAKILDFVLKFDECKMTTPAVQNDFSYYRRTIQRNRNSASRSAELQIVDALPIDVANQMSLFFAHATPLLNKLSEVTSGFVRASSERVAANTTDVLSVMSKVCQKMLENRRELKSRLRFAETEPFILRVMVATVILYDHVHPAGAFTKGSSVDVKGCVKLLRDPDLRTDGKQESLLNALRYTTRHLNDEGTPKSIKALLFEEGS